MTEKRLADGMERDAGDESLRRLYAMTDEERKVLEEAARMVSGGWSGAAFGMIYEMLVECAKHHRTAGLGSFESWIASIQALGETCLTIARLERKKKRQI